MLSMENEFKNHEQTPVNPLRRALRKALMSAIKRASRKAEKLQAESEECANSGQWLECGEIIKANLEMIKRGDTSATLPDMYHPGKTRTVELDPFLKPLDNAKKYFKKQRKLKKGADKVAAELSICKEELSGLEKLKSDFDKWQEESEPDLPPPEELLARAEKHRVHIPGAPQPEQSKNPRKQEQPSGVKIFESHDGLKILVGKNSRDNDNLSFRIARGNDWWFHVANQSGSHVVVKGVGKPAKGQKNDSALPQETMLDAAHLAVYFSKARRATRADVTCTQAKHLRKRKNAPAGQVTVIDSKRIQLRIEEDRLSRLLKRHDSENE